MINIRPTEYKDIPAIAYLEEVIFSSPWSEESLNRFLGYDYARFFTAFEDDTVIGYIGSYKAGDELDIINVAVDEKYRGRGIGRSLVEKVLEAAGADGCPAVNLEVRESNDTAKRLYENLGFVNLGIRKNFYSKPTENANIYRYDFDMK